LLLCELDEEEPSDELEEEVFSVSVPELLTELDEEVPASLELLKKLDDDVPSSPENFSEEKSVQAERKITANVNKSDNNFCIGGNIENEKNF